MSAMTQIIGYPVHAVAKFVRWENQYGVKFTDWLSRCGETGTKARHEPFGNAGQARKGELCSKCFPGGDYRNAPDTKPEQLASLDDLQGATA